MKKTINGITYDTEQATGVGSIYLGLGPWDGPMEVLRRTASGHYFIHREWPLFDGRRMKPDEIPWQLMGKKRDFDRLTEQHEVEPISRAQALLLCLELRIPKDLRPELRKFIRSRKALPPFRPAKD
jgi:hypothetical protein